MTAIVIAVFAVIAIFVIVCMIVLVRDVWQMLAACAQWAWAFARRTRM